MIFIALGRVSSTGSWQALFKVKTNFIITKKPMRKYSLWLFCELRESDRTFGEAYNNFEE